MLELPVGLIAGKWESGRANQALAVNGGCSLLMHLVAGGRARARTLAARVVRGGAARVSRARAFLLRTRAHCLVCAGERAGGARKRACGRMLARLIAHSTPTGGTHRERGQEEARGCTVPPRAARGCACGGSPFVCCGSTDEMRFILWSCPTVMRGVRPARPEEERHRMGAPLVGLGHGSSPGFGNSPGCWQVRYIAARWALVEGAWGRGSRGRRC